MTTKIIGTVSCCVECEYCKPNDNGGISCDLTDVPIFDAGDIADFCPLPTVEEHRYDNVNVPNWFMDFCVIHRGITRYTAQKAYSRILRMKRTGLTDNELWNYPLNVIMDLFDPAGKISETENSQCRYALRLYRCADKHQKLNAKGYAEYVDYCTSVRRIAKNLAEHQFSTIIALKSAGFTEEEMLTGDERVIVDKFAKKTKRRLSRNAQLKYRQAIRNYVGYIQHTGETIDANVV